MSGTDLVEFIFVLIDKLIDFGNVLFDFISASFTIGDFTFRVIDFIGVSFITLMGLRFIKKFLPVA